MASSSTHATQADALRSRLPRPDSEGANKPGVLLKSPLELTLEQEQQLMTHINGRRHSMSTELARLNYFQSQWISHLTALMAQSQTQVMPFFALRHLAHMIMEGRMEWRKALSGEDSLWHHSNFHLPLCGRIIPQQIARAVDYYFGTAPWFTATPVGMSDREKAEPITRWTRHEADKSKLEGVLRDALALAFVQGEQVVATQYAKQVDFYETVREVAIDPTTSEPFTAMDGDYLFRSDTFVPVPPPADPTLTPEQAASLPPVGMVLKRDQKTPMPDWWNAVVWQWTKLRRENIRNDGARAYNVHYMDFMCPTTAPNIQDADCIVHIESTPVIAFIHAMLVEEWEREQTSVEERQKVIANLLSKIPGSSSGTTTDAAAVNQPRAEMQETANMQGTATAEPHLATAKHWVHYDVNGDGLLESIMVLTTADGTTPIYYDYTANLTDDGERPYDVVRVNPVANRWHGVGQVQKFFQLQQLADLLFNRINFSQMQSARVDFWRPELTVEGAADPTLKLNWGRTYRISGDHKPENILHSVYLQNIKAADLHALLELVMQIAMNMSGVANVNDSRMAGLDTAQLATGVKNLQQAGQELFGKFLSDLTPSIQSILTRFFKLSLANIKGSRAYKFMEGDVAAFAEINPDDLRDIDLDITIDLSRYSGQQQLAEVQQQIVAVRDYIALNPSDPYTAQMTMRPFVVEMLKVLGVRDAERKIPVPQQPLALMPGGATAPGAPGPTPAPAIEQPPAKATA
jgi:hypothetical protein